MVEFKMQAQKTGHNILGNHKINVEINVMNTSKEFNKACFLWSVIMSKLYLQVH